LFLSSFQIANESDLYRIQFSGYSGTAGDGMVRSTYNCNNQQFSTLDNVQ